MDSQQGGWPKTPHFMAKKDVMKRDDLKVIDYVDIMPGGSYKRPTAEERERIKDAAEKCKEIAEKHDATFKITKGDES